MEKIYICRLYSHIVQKKQTNTKAYVLLCLLFFAEVAHVMAQNDYFFSATLTQKQVYLSNRSGSKI